MEYNRKFRYAEKQTGVIETEGRPIRWFNNGIPKDTLNNPVINFIGNITDVNCWRRVCTMETLNINLLDEGKELIECAQRKTNGWVLVASKLMLRFDDKGIFILFLISFGHPKEEIRHIPPVLSAKLIKGTPQRSNVFFKKKKKS